MQLFIYSENLVSINHQNVLRLLELLVIYHQDKDIFSLDLENDDKMVLLVVLTFI